MTRILLSVLLVAGFAYAARAGEAAKKDTDEKKPRPAQVLCPITNANVFEWPISSRDPETVVIDGFTFLVRDKDAAKKAADNPKAVFAALAKNKDAAVPVSPVCPQMGYKVNQDLYAQKDGRRIYVCCKGCITPVERRWNDALKKVNELSKQPVPEDLKGM